MTKRIMIRILSISMVLAVVFSATAFPVEARDYAQEIKDLENKIDANNSNINSKQQSIDYMESQISTMQKQIDVYNEKIEALNKDISEKDALIQQKESEISALTAEIDNTNKKIEEQNITINKTYDILKERLRASYMAGETSTLEIILNSKDFESFLTRMELVSSVSKHDTGLVKDIEVQIAELKKMNDSLTANKADLESKKAQSETEKLAIVSARAEVQATSDVLNKKQEQIQAKVYEQNAAIEKLDKSSKEYNRLIEQAEDEQRKQSEIDAGLGGSGDGTLPPSDDGSHGFKVSSKGMISPLQGKTYISDGFGGSRNHLGLDICISGLTYGKPIYAAASGVVKKAIVIKGTNNKGYGNYIIIDHGNGVTTTYAHALSLNVSENQRVSQGQQIAIAGNTGNVIPGPAYPGDPKGSHLHFEVRKNGKIENPVLWLP